MQTHEIRVSRGREKVYEIRSELFAFPEVLDVLVTARPDALVVVYLGRPRPGEWLRALHAIGCRTAARGHAGWPHPEQRSEGLLRPVGESPYVGANDGNWTTSPIRDEQTPRRRRDAA